MPKKNYSKHTTTIVAMLVVVITNLYLRPLLVDLGFVRREAQETHDALGAQR